MPSAPSAQRRRRRGLLPAAVLLFVIAALWVVRAVLPADLVVDTWDAGGAQFAAFYLTLLGVGLVQANDNARRFVCFASVPLLLLASALVITGETYDKLVGATLAALAIGLFVLLFGRDASAGRVAAGVALAGAGATLFFPAEVALARAPREEARRRLAEWRAADPKFAREDIGVRVAAPEGWTILRPGSPYVPVDSAELVSLLHDATQARAVVALDPDLHPGETLDRALDRFVERWRTRVPDLEAGARSAVPLGSVPGRRVEVTWKHEDEPAWSGQAVAWQDASRTLFFAAWYPTGAAEKAVPEVESLTAALSVLRPLSARIAATAVKAASELPQMTPHAIEILVARRPEADPPTLFREGLAAASIGFQRLDPAQTRDMGAINRALYGQMPAADSSWMEDYVRRVRSAQATSPEEDARAMRAMAAAVGRLPEASRAELRAILENAVVAAVRG